MIKNGLIPNIEHSVAIDYGFEPVRTECAKRNREKAKRRGNSTKHNHFLCYLQSHFTSAKVPIPFATYSKRESGPLRSPKLREREIQTAYCWLILRLHSA